MSILEDSGSENMINFNISPERMFVPLVPIPTEPTLISLEYSPFDNSEAASYSSGDPFELVLKSVTKTKPSRQSVEVQKEKSKEMWKPAGDSKLSDETETSYSARVAPVGQSQSLVKALALEGMSNFRCNENVVCLMDISDPTGFDISSEFTNSSVTADKSAECSNSFLKFNANADDQKESAVLEQDITTLVNEKLNSCIQMVLNRSCSKLQQGGSASVKLRRSLGDPWHTNDCKGAEIQNKQASSVRKSLDMSLDNAAKVSYLLGGGTEMNSRATSSSDASTTGSVFNRAFLRNASSDAPSATSQGSGTSCSSASTSAFPLGCSNAVTSIRVRRWLDTADVRMRALSCDNDLTCTSPSADCQLPSPARTARVLDNSSLSSVFSPPSVTKPGSTGGGESSQSGSNRSVQDLSPEDRLSGEALRVAHNISNRFTGNAYNETLDDIEVDLFSSDDERSEHSNSMQQNERVLWSELAMEPLPLNMERVASLSLQRGPVLPPPLFDQSRLVMRLKQLKAANQLPPDKKLVPLKATVPLGDMSKAADNNVCASSVAHKISQPLFSAQICENKTEETVPVASANSFKQQEISTKPKLKKNSVSVPSSRSSSLPRSRQSSASSGSSGTKAKLKSGLPVPHQTPLSTDSDSLSYLNASRDLVTSTPINPEKKGARASHVSPSVTPVPGARQLNRHVSNSLKSSKENVVNKCSEVGARRSKSASNITPMKSVENQMTGVRGSDRGGRKPHSLDKVLSLKKKQFTRAAGEKENIMPV